MEPLQHDPADAEHMAELRLAAELRSAFMACTDQRSFDTFCDRLHSLTDHERRSALWGLLYFAATLPDEILAPYLLMAEVDLPAPSRPMPADQLRPDDVIRLHLVDDDVRVGFEDHVVEAVSPLGEMVTITFADSALSRRRARAAVSTRSR